MGDEALIELKEVTKRFNKNTILDGISLSIPKGKILGIIGRSGCGKTTLLNIIIGFVKPNKGSILFNNKNIFKEMKDVEELFGFASQDFSFYEELTAKENLEYFSKLYGLKKKAINSKVNELLKLVGLEDSRNKISRQLSSGMKRRLDIACSLVHEPKVLLLDEPTQDLDPLLRREILKLIQKINKDGTTVIITTHLLGEIDHLCDQVAILNNGKVAKINSPNELVQDITKNKMITIETASRKYDYIIKRLKTLRLVDHIIESENRLVIHTPKPQITLDAVMKTAKANKDQLNFIQLSKPSLDDVFESLIMESKA